MSALETTTPAMYSKSLAMIDDLIYKLQNNQFIASSSKPSSQSTTNSQGASKQKGNNTASSSSAKPKAQKKDTTNKPSIPSSPFHQTYIVVARIEAVEKHPESEKLYKMTLSVGQGQHKNLVAGLRKFYSEDQLLHRKVLAILNLKPKKLAGVLSEAMVLAGSTGSGDNETVKVLEPADEAQVGDRVILEKDFDSEQQQWKSAYVSSPEDRCSPNQWEKMVKELSVLNGQPSYAKQILCVAGQQQTIKVKCELPDGSEIH
ncbi:hypothetical protein C9374_013387 [Naegleria lovaniensis]|uniref:tRNA-binding domain-containing protein n=1 Tax=Naegleria lovaniensis TaxID=51637 RepID=A0AA88H234_NAELO|nr:uncharacterized protein C9374_013387 [Naegleria lovaniensis]KAG2391902.1 hypothetical protein C9374_013387 [Naegleria lovaniensis]